MCLYPRGFVLHPPYTPISLGAVRQVLNKDGFRVLLKLLKPVQLCAGDYLAEFGSCDPAQTPQLVHGVVTRHAVLTWHVAIAPTFFSPSVLPPFLFVVRAGSSGTEMFVITTGALDVLDQYGSLVGTLRPISTFGEFVAFGKEKMRTASLVAVTTTEVNVLDGDDLKKSFADFPEVESLSRRASRHLRETCQLPFQLCLQAYPSSCSFSCSFSCSLGSIRATRRKRAPCRPHAL